ncbi:hypothetical protein FRIGORI9N_400121 [Frigoribacterium sp. 9N]|nr:hypothetical protein FRIGORI9N_400121 [Frigoribacterium sp. 9N]
MPTPTAPLPEGNSTAQLVEATPPRPNKLCPATPSTQRATEGNPANFTAKAFPNTLPVSPTQPANFVASALPRLSKLSGNTRAVSFWSSESSFRLNSRKFPAWQQAVLSEEAFLRVVSSKGEGGGGSLSRESEELSKGAPRKGISTARAVAHASLRLALAVDATQEVPHE